MIARFARYVLLVLLGLLVIAIAIVMTLDFGRFKGDAEVFVSNLLQREFSINGPLHLSIGRTIEFSAAEVTLASTDWTSTPKLLSVRQVKASINTWSLIDGPIRIETFSLDGLQANLVKNESGDNNWSFGGSTDKPVNGSDEVSVKQDPAARPTLPVLLENIEITDVVIVYQDPVLTHPMRMVIDRVNGVTLESQEIQLKLDGDINDTPVGLNLNAGKMENLVEFSGVEFNFDGHFGEIQFVGASAMTDLLNPRQPTANLSLSGPNIEYFTDILGLPRIATGPLKMDLSLAPVEDKVELNLDGTFGEFVVLANGQFNDLQDLQDIDLKLSTSGPNAGRVMDFLGVRGFPGIPFYIAGSLRRSGPVVSIDSITATVGKTKLSLSGQLDNFPNPDSATISVKINGKDIGEFNQLLNLPGKIDGPFNLNADLAPNADTGVDFTIKAKVSGISFKAQGVYIDGPNLKGSKARIQYQVADLRTVSRALGIEPLPKLPAKGSVLVERIDGGIAVAEGSLMLGNDQFRFDGKVGDDPLQSGTDIRLQVKIPDLPATVAEFGIEVPYVPSGELKTAMQISASDKKLVLSDLSLTVAGLKAEIEAKLSLDSVLSDSDIRFRIEGDDLTELVPPNEVFRTPNKAFSLDGSVRLEPDVARISKLQFRVGANHLSADVELGLEPLLESARATITASGPNLYELSPQFAEYSVPRVAPFELRSEVVWQDGLLSINDLFAQIGDGKIELSGSIEGPPNFDRSDLRLVLHIADMNNLSLLVERELPHESADLSLHFLGEANTIKLEEFDGRFGDSDLTGDFLFRAGETPEVIAKFTLNRLNLTPYLLPGELADPPAESDNEASPGPAPDGRVIPATPIPFDLLEGYVANVDLRIKELNLRRHTVRDLVLSAAIVDASLAIERFSVKTESGGELRGRLELKPNQNGAEIRMKILGNNLRLGLPAETEQELEALPQYDLNLAFITSGGNSREIAATATGYLKLTSGEGRIKANSMQVFTNDFLTKLMNTVNPFTKSDPYTNLKCTVVLATVEQGKITGEPIIVVQSERLNILARASIDLGTESLNAEFRTVPQKGLGFSLSSLVNPYVGVGGTLAAPKLSLNKESVLIEGSAAVATGGLSILALGLKDRFLSDKNPCETAVNNAADDFAALEAKHAGLRWPDLN